MGSLLVLLGALHINDVLRNTTNQQAVQTVFLSLAILFFLLATAHFIPQLQIIAGIEGIFGGFSAFYLSLAEVLNETNKHKNAVPPIGPMLNI